MEELLQEMRQYAEENWVPIIKPAAQAFLLAEIVKRKPGSVLEIGTAIGYSTLLIAAHLPPGGTVTTIEVDGLRAAMAHNFIARTDYAGQITLYPGDAAEVLPHLSASYDFVFIDAGKGHYLDYLTPILDRLNDGAVIFADNVLFNGWVLGGGHVPRRQRTIAKRLRQYLDFVSNDPRFETSLHPEGDGVAISIYQGEKNRANS